MTEATFAVLMLLVLAWAVTSHLLDRLNVTGALVFAVAGYLLGNPTWGPLAVDVATPSIHRLAELALALLLFADAARVNVSQLRRDISFPGRLLGIGLPALGDPRLARRRRDVRRLLLGTRRFRRGDIGSHGCRSQCAGDQRRADSAAVASCAERGERSERRHRDTRSSSSHSRSSPARSGRRATPSPSAGGALVDLALGVVVGLVLGFGSARLITSGSRRRWIVAGGRRLATLAAALASFALAVALDGNGFIAAFVAGIAFGAGLPKDVAESHEAAELPELLGEFMALAVWFLFGAALVPVALDHLSASTLAYALLSLTVLRMVPVALSLLGAGLDGWTVGFVGWFGPRGLASVVFALLAIEELGESPMIGEAIAVVALTVC